MDTVHFDHFYICSQPFTPLPTPANPLPAFLSFLVLFVYFCDPLSLTGVICLNTVGVISGAWAGAYDLQCLWLRRS